MLVFEMILFLIFLDDCMVLGSKVTKYKEQSQMLVHKKMIELLLAYHVNFVRLSIFLFSLLDTTILR